MHKIEYFLRSILVTDNDSELAPLIAIIGCDGSGKSTVNESVLNWVENYTPAAAAHLGKQSGNIGRVLSNLPLIGKWIDPLITREVIAVENSIAKKKTPGLFPALVMYAFTIRRIRRFKRMLSLRHQGLIIITDRYPQLSLPEAYDGPSLSDAAQGNFIVRWLARREQAAFEWMTAYRPDLVVRLNVDLDTACKRKPDHIREKLKRKIDVTPLLSFNGAPIAEINTVQPLEKVLDDVKKAIAPILNKRGYKISVT